MPVTEKTIGQLPEAVSLDPNDKLEIETADGTASKHIKASNISPGPQGIQGDSGPQGDEGPKGDKGDPGGSFEYEQLLAATTWGPITHDLNYYPAVTVIDSAGTLVIGSVDHHSRNSLSIQFSTPFAGTASLT